MPHRFTASCSMNSGLLAERGDLEVMASAALLEVFSPGHVAEKFRGEIAMSCRLKRQGMRREPSLVVCCMGSRFIPKSLGDSLLRTIKIMSSVKMTGALSFPHTKQETHKLILFSCGGNSTIWGASQFCPGPIGETHNLIRAHMGFSLNSGTSKKPGFRLEFVSAKPQKGTLNSNNTKHDIYIYIYI